MAAVRLGAASVPRGCGSVPRPMRLRVVSLNVWALPAPVGRHVGERVDLILRDLPALDCDVALFQEVWRDEVREEMRAGGRAAGLPHCWWLPGPARGGSGLLALSRWPIEDPHFRRFTLCGIPQRIDQMDYYSGKGIARFTVRPDGRPLVLCNTHLHARYAGLEVEDDYIGHRAAEIVEIADELRSIREPVVAVGDFNLRDVSPEYRLLIGMTGLVDVAAQLGEKRPTSILDNAWRRLRGSVSESRIDYVFGRSGTREGITPVAAKRVFDTPVEVAGRTRAYSDHAGVLAELAVGEPGMPPHRIPPSAFALGRELLDNGRRRARRRRARERVGAGASAVAAVAAVGAARRRRFTRRRVLRAGLGLAAAGAAASAAGLTLLAEHFVPRELADFDAIASLLARIQAQEAPGAGEPRPGPGSLR